MECSEWETTLLTVLCVIFVVIRAVKFVILKLADGADQPPNCEGFAAPGWNRVAEVFKKQVKGGHLNGGGFAVYHKGQLVVEYVGGYADFEAKWPWNKTMLSCLYSSTKGIGAIVIAILVDRGLLDYSYPVAFYWPEFAANGKASITVEDLLSHQAGLIVLDEDYTLFDVIEEPDRMSRLLAAARPQWKPGTAHGFHSITIGLYMDQLVRRVDPKHRSIDKFFTEEVSVKFGIDCFIGLPKEECHRCARLQGFSIVSLLPQLLMNPRYLRLTGELLMEYKDSNLFKMANNCQMEKWMMNNPTFREIPCASTNGFATVAGLAQLYGILANGGCHEGNTLLSSSAVEKLNEPLVSGIDSVFHMNSTVGRGTFIMKSEDGHNIFGHPGSCGQAGFADPKHKIGWAYIANRPSFYHYADDWRYRQLIEAMYETIRELELQKELND